MSKPRRTGEWGYLENWTNTLDGVLRGIASLVSAAATIGISWTVMWRGEPIEFAWLIFGSAVILGAIVWSFLSYMYLFHIALRFVHQEAKRENRPYLLIALMVIFALSFTSLQFILVQYVLVVGLPGDSGV